MADSAFPHIEEQPKYPWVEALSRSDRRAYEETRASDIAKDVATIKDKITRMGAFEGASEAAIDHLALWMATWNRNGYEEGIQVGQDSVQAETTALRRFKFHSQEAVAG